MTEYTNPTRERFREMVALPDDGPIHMLNLIRLRAQATYPDGRAATGAEAYGEYSRLTAPILADLGGRIAWSGDFRFMLIGPGDKGWDIAFIAEYPNGDAFRDMLKRPDYQAAVIHRTAAVKDSRLIRFAPKDPGQGFG